MVAEYDEASRGKKLPERAGNTDYLVVPQSAASVDSPIENVEVPPSKYVEVAGTNTSHVQTTPITAYRGAIGDY